MEEKDLFELHKERLIKDGIDITNGIFGLSEVHESMALHAKVFAEYIIKDGIVEHSEDVVGNLGVNQGGEFGFSHLIESLDGDASAINFRNVDAIYEQFSKAF
jgi:hypothetical protein